MKILYLYAELMGYQIPVFKEYVNKYAAQVHVIHFDSRKLTPYIPPELPNVTYYPRSSFTSKSLKQLVKKINPDISYISGWMDIAYLKAARFLRSNGIPVVAGSDGIYFNTFKQKLATLFFPLVRKNFYSHYWVPGPYQYEYAKRLGFKNHEIIFNCYSADIELFNSAFDSFHQLKKNKYPHRFLYVGRLEKLKGLDLLESSWNNICKRNENKDWELHLIGNGILFDELKKNKNVNVKNFLMPDELADEIKLAGCFILPSRYEPWALVLHEFAAAGLPIICTNVCGASPVFITSGYNGYIINPENIYELEQKILKIINSSDELLMEMSEKSHAAGQKINPEITAASFMSILSK